jgi:hypothetical protein
MTSGYAMVSYFQNKPPVSMHTELLRLLTWSNVEMIVDNLQKYINSILYGVDVYGIPMLTNIANKYFRVSTFAMSALQKRYKELQLGFWSVLDQICQAVLTAQRGVVHDYDKFILYILKDSKPVSTTLHAFVQYRVSMVVPFIPPGVPPHVFDEVYTYWSNLKSSAYRANVTAAPSTVASTSYVAQPQNHQQHTLPPPPPSSHGQSQYYAWQYPILHILNGTKK